MDNQEVMSNLSREVEMLRFKLSRLRDLEIVLTPVDEARLLQSQCEILERAIANSWGEAHNFMADLRYFIREGNRPRGVAPPNGYAQWLGDHLRLHDETAHIDYYIPKLSIRCSQTFCIHYIYGFSSLEELIIHLDRDHTIDPALLGLIPPYNHQQQQQHQQLPPRSLAFDLPESNFPFACSLNEDTFSPTQPLAETPSTTSFVPLSLNQSPMSEDKISSSLLAQKQRTKYFRSGRVKTNTNLEMKPCLRCKVLHKQCDGERYCKKCPTQDHIAIGDHWKVIGCHRGFLGELGRLFLPACNPETSEGNVAVVATGHKFWSMWLERERPLILSERVQFLHFLRRHEQSLCDVIFTRLMHHGILDQDDMEFTSRRLAPLWSQFYLIKLYLRRDSPLNENLESFLVQCWNQITQSRDENTNASILTFFTLSTSFLECKREYNLNESSDSRKSSMDGDLIKFSFDLQYHLLKSLTCCLDTCFNIDLLKRNSLQSHQWLSMFRFLYLFGVVSSLLIDAQTGMNAPLKSNIRHSSVVAGIDSAYRALVSLFAWASKRDFLFDFWTAQNDAQCLESLYGVHFIELQRIVQRKELEKFGFKSTKDFLMRFGSSFYNTGNLLGFAEYE